MANTITIEYACDAEGDFTAPINQCVDNNKRTFDLDTQLEEVRNFVDKCSYVYNLDDVLGKICHKPTINTHEKNLLNTNI